MASCDDDFGLLGDEAQSQQQQQQVHHHHHHHHHHQQQAQQQQRQQQGQPLPQQLSVPFSHRYITAAAAAAAAAAANGGGGGGVSIHPHSHPRSVPHLNAITSPNKGASSSVDEGSYAETFAQSDVNNHHHGFHTEVDHGFVPPLPQSHIDEGDGEDDDEEEEGHKDRRSCGEAVAAAAAPHHLPPSTSRHHQQADPKRKDREELSDGESPSIYYTAANNSNNSKKSRPIIPSSSSGDYRKDREEWSDSAISCLLDAYTEKYIQLNRGNLRGRDWEDVATIVSERCDKHKSGKSVEQCKNKVDNLKKRYKVECQRLSSGCLPVSHWPWFKKMEQIVGSSSSSSKQPNTDEDKSSPLGGASTPTSRQLKRFCSFSVHSVPFSVKLLLSFLLLFVPQIFNLINICFSLTNKQI